MGGRAYNHITTGILSMMILLSSASRLLLLISTLVVTHATGSDDSGDDDVQPITDAPAFPPTPAPDDDACGCVSPECIVQDDIENCQCRDDGAPPRCDFVECCDRRRRRRRRDLSIVGQASMVLDGNDFHHDEESYYRDYLLERCGSFGYEASVYVDGHLYAVAVPGEEALAAACPLIAAHALFRERDTPATKQLLIWDDYPNYNDSVVSGALSLGTSKLSELLGAYTETDPDTARGYDVLSNNCGNFVVDLASHLGLEIDARVKSFVVRRLIEESGTKLAHKIRSHLDFSFFGRRLRSESRTDDDETLVELLVEKTASARPSP